MPSLRLSSRASADLDRILVDGVERFGISQAQNFLTEIFDVFDLLVLNPEMGRALHLPVGEIRVFSQPKPCRILYRPIDEGVLIARVVHGQQDLQRALAELEV